MSSQLIILSCLVLVVTLSHVEAQSQFDLDLEKQIELIFGPDPASAVTAPDSKQCTMVEPDLPGCNECYPCHHSVIEHYRRENETVREIRLTSPSCEYRNVCCISQSVLVGARIGGACGKRVETGRQRVAPRAVLQGEYPWQAFVYQDVSGKRTLLCGATYIHEGTKALLTSASCVKGKSPRSLLVSFSVPPGRGKMARVASVTTHQDYKADKQHNDIALITLQSLDETPRYISPACMPEVAPQHALSCRAIAFNQYLINTHIPKSKVCRKSLGQPHQSLLCATTLRGDFEPQHGSALFCETQHEKNPSFVMHGIALKTDDQSITTYTNLTNFITWIYDRIEN